MRKQRAFAVLLLTQTLSFVGSRMTSVALGLWLYQRAGQTTPLLLTTFFAELPGLLTGGLAGVLVDRWDRKHVLVGADAGQAMGTLILLVSLLSGQFRLWHLYGVTLAQGAFAIAQQSARDASTTLLIPEARRERANALLQMSFPLAGAIGPALTGALYGTTGLAGILAIDLLTFAVAAVAVAFVRLPRPQPTSEGRAVRGNVWRELSGALRFLTARPALLGLVLHAVAVNFLLNGPLELAVPYLMSVTGSEALTGGLAGVMSLGGFAGAALVAIWGGTRPRIHTYAVSLLCAGVLFLVYGTVRAPWLLGLSLFCLILPLPIMGTMYNSILQVKSPPDMQGRIFGLTAQTGFLGATASFLLVGPLVDRVLSPATGRARWSLVAPLVGRDPAAGIGALLVITGFLLLAVTGALYASPAIRHLEETLPDYQ